jgi:ribosomal protein S18 acetylase RimI-like enzyme
MNRSSGRQRPPNFVEQRPAAPANLTIRPAEASDVPAMASIRALEWETQEYWERRLGNYLAGNLGARHALPGHAMFVAVVDEQVAGFVAGHRTTRHGCQGELEFINVDRGHRGSGIAGKLLATMAVWFAEREAMRVCVDVVPENSAARALYAKYGAVDLKPNWMVWEDIRTALAGHDARQSFGV